MASDSQKHLLGCTCESCVMKNRARAAARAERQGASATRTAQPSQTGTPHTDRGQRPPIGNTGETYSHPIAETVELILADGKIKQVMHRVPAKNECAVVDTIRFTVHQSTFQKTSLMAGDILAPRLLSAPDEIVRAAFKDPLWRESFKLALEADNSPAPISDDDFVKEASRVFESVFGFGVTKATGKGRDFYRDAYILGDKFGYVCIGNAGKNDQRGTMLVELNGLGCINALLGWEQRLHTFLADIAEGPSLTRVDLAFDDMDGKLVGPDWAEAQWLAGGFTKCVGKNPHIERAGNWHEITGAGRTLYIGSRKHSSLFVRTYEKGMEQGAPNSPWTRVEVEIKNSDRVVPLDVLLHPSDYFIGTYPALAFLNAHRTPERIKVKRQKAEIGVQAAKEIIKHQFGKYLRVLRDLHDGDADKVLSELVNEDPNAWPDRLTVLCPYIPEGRTFLHEIPTM
ncbi:MAG: replication initiation factor domain-containing protein [Pedobacter sp.]|nr:replication initiation factor domain-containing protein [Pedobacter sp.]